MNHGIPVQHLRFRARLPDDGDLDGTERFYGVDQVAFAQQIRLGRDQDGSVEADFLGAHLPFHAGGFHGVSPTDTRGPLCCRRSWE